MKFRRKIGKGVIDEVYEKISRLKFKDILSIRPVLIYEGRMNSLDHYRNYIRLADVISFPGDQDKA